MKKLLLIITASIALVSCEKQERWLDVKSNKSDVVPKTLKDYQALLDNTTIMNSGTPALGLLSADNYYITDVVATTQGTVTERNAYVWAPDIYEGAIASATTSDWIYPYRAVEYCNIVLTGIEDFEASQSTEELRNLKGSAHFFRAYAFFNVAQLYAKPYNKASAITDLGIPIRLSADVNVKSERTTVAATYDQIISDILQSIEYLPEIPVYRTRPCKQSAYALLARTYLNMGEYSLSLKYANLSMESGNTILDFNTISGTPTYPFPTYQLKNPEVSFYATTLSYLSSTLANMFVVDELYNLYHTNDLRRSLFFRVNADGSKNFRGRYTGSSGIFSGIANNEILIIIAECQARLGNIQDGMNTLNTLLIKRWKTGTFVPFVASSETSALNIILTERRKEMPFSGSTRWEDLRRLNFDPRFAKTLTRVVNGQTFTLLPNDKRYVLPIIPAEIDLSGLPQNPR